MIITQIPCISWELERILRWTSLWPGVYNIPACIVLCLPCLTIMPFQYTRALETLDDAIQLIPNICDITSEITLFLKYFIAWANRGLLIDLLHEMADDWQKLETKVTLETQMSCLFARSNIYFLCGAIVLFLPQVTIAYFTETIDKRQFTMQTSYPFDAKRSPIYEIVNIIHVVQITIMAVADAIPFALMVALVCHFGAQLNVLQGQLIKFIKNVKGVDHVNHESLQAAANLIKSHQKSIEFAAKIEFAFTYMSLVHTLSSIVCICWSGLAIMVSRDPIYVTRFMFYIIMKLYQAFVPCYAGEYLASMNMGIGHVIYDSDWYKLHPSYMKMLQLIMVRAQSSIVLTAGKFATLSATTFATIVKTAGSYMSLLYTLY